VDLILEQHRIECAAIFERLLAASEFPFDGKLSSCLPKQHGLYAIKRQQASNQDEYLHAGRSIRAATGLRSRIWDQHFWGGGRGAEGDLVDKVVKKQYAHLGIPQGSTTNQQYRRIAQDWISQNCVVQWLVLEDADVRCWAEHYMLAVLRPIWGR
jgi:hypothetical protein